MKGKILGAGAISGEDGVRYYYDEQELKNFKEGQKIEGCEVDFDIKDGKAVGVYIVNGGGFNSGFGKVGANVGASLENVSLPSFDNKFVFWDLNEAKANLFRPNIHSIKFWFVLFLILNFFNILNLFPNTNLTWSNTDILTGQKIGGGTDFSGITSWIFNLIIIPMFIWISYCFGVLANTHKLLKYTAAAFVALVINAWLTASIISSIVTSSLVYALDMFNRGGGSSISVPYFKIICALIFFVVMIVYIVKWIKLLSQMTSQKEYVWALYLFIFIAIVGRLLGLIFLFNLFDIATKHDMKGFQSLTENINFLADLSLPIVIVFVILTFGATLKFREIKQISQNA